MLKDNKDINLTATTLYCVDNEALRCLYSAKRGFKCEDGEMLKYAESWTKSVEEIGKLVRHVTDLKPYPVKNSLSLNNARRIIVEFAKPLEEITENINKNIEAIEAKEKHLFEANFNISCLTKDLLFPQIELRSVLYEHPHIVCTSDRCAHEVKENGVTTTQYSCKFDEEGRLWKRSIRWKENESFCTRCNCSWNVHTKKKYECQKVEKFVENRRIAEKIAQKATAMELAQFYLADLRDLGQELTHEHEEIIRVSRKFATFLKKCAITPYNDAIVGYLKYFIEETEGNDKKLIEQLRQKHAKYVDVLEKALADGQCDEDPPTPTDIERMIDELCRLKHSGLKLQEVMKTAAKAEQKDVDWKERVVDVTRQGVGNCSINNLQMVFAVI